MLVFFIKKKQNLKFIFNKNIFRLFQVRNKNISLCHLLCLSKNFGIYILCILYIVIIVLTFKQSGMHCILWYAHRACIYLASWHLILAILKPDGDFVCQNNTSLVITYNSRKSKRLYFIVSVNCMHTQSRLLIHSLLSNN